MKIAIVNLTAGGLSSGYQKYLLNVIPRMSVHPWVDSMLCACPRTVYSEHKIGPFPNTISVTCSAFNFMNIITHKSDKELRGHLKRFSPDILFVPIERALTFESIPVVNMVQNMAPFFPIINNPPRERIKQYFRYRLAKDALKRSDGIIAVSQFVRDFLIDEWAIPSEKVKTIYHGLDKDDLTDRRPHTIPEGWDRNFLFTAGSIDPYRGLEDAIHALKAILSSNIKIRGLVIAGDMRPKVSIYKKNLENLIKKYNILSRVIWAGKLGEEEMRWCYRNCALFLMTSRIEACPNIALEAMSYGCITIAADNPPLPELFGDSAVYYHPYHYSTLAYNIIHLSRLCDFDRQAIRTKGLERARNFSWDRTADETVKMLLNVAETKKD